MNEDTDQIGVHRDLDRRLQGTRDKRFTVYIDSEQAQIANEYVEESTFPTVSVVLDTAIRRQLLHEIQIREDYRFLLKELNNLPAKLAYVSIEHSEPRKEDEVRNQLEDGKTVLAGRTNSAIYVIMKSIIHDRRTMYSTDSEFVEKGILRLSE